MTNIVEIHWNAKPHLARLGVKVGGSALDPRAERLFDEVRGSVANVFPGCVTLVRIAVRSKEAADDIRIVRHGSDQSADDSAKVKVRRRIEEAVERATAAAAETEAAA